MKHLITLAAFFSLAIAHAQIKVLFDASKAEMAGNADWVIDADVYNLGVNGAHQMAVGSGNESNPQRIPTPAQSGINTSTSQTYWKGALSYWAVDLVRKGYTVETLPYNGAITYGTTTNTQDLANYKVFVVDEPNIRFTSAEKAAIVHFVQNGGGLFMVSDHTVSDRNNDGWDSPAIWNDLLTSNGVQTNPFGISFDLQNFSQTSTNVRNLPSDPILHGTQGNVTGIQFNNGTSMTLNATADPSVLGLVYKTGASNTGTTQVVFAAANYGTGKVCALGDSSVPDDGSGDTHDALYSSYGTAVSGSHRNLLVNAVVWLATSGTPPSAPRAQVPMNEVPVITAGSSDLQVFPNPTTDVINLRYASASAGTMTIEVLDATGRTMLVRAMIAIAGMNETRIDMADMPDGVYMARVTRGVDVTVRRFLRK